MTDIRQHFPVILSCIHHYLAEPGPSELLIAKLRELLPASYGIGAGSLVTAHGEQSRPFDVVIYDKTLTQAQQQLVRQSHASLPPVSYIFADTPLATSQPYELSQHATSADVPHEYGAGAVLSLPEPSSPSQQENDKRAVSNIEAQRQNSWTLPLDEINLAPPAMQGMAQQLILDRRVGSYTAPERWFIWAAGNRKEDRAAVFDMPAPLANRFIHLTVEPHFESCKAYVLGHGAHEHILAFLAFRPELLHKLDPQQPAWPSPRSWMVASRLYRVGLDIAHVVGAGAAAKFIAFRKLYDQLPDIEAILQGNGDKIGFPKEPSQRYALTMALTMRASDLQESYQAFRWISHKAAHEWIQLFATDLFRRSRARNELGKLATLVQRGSELPKPVGGGGTDFRPFFRAIEPEIADTQEGVCVYLTDGYGTFPSQPPSLPVLWLLSPGGLATDRVPFGESIRLIPD